MSLVPHICLYSQFHAFLFVTCPCYNIGHATAQMINYCLPTIASQFQSQVRPSGICDKAAKYFGFHCQFSFTNGSIFINHSTTCCYIVSILTVSLNNQLKGKRSCYLHNIRTVHREEELGVQDNK
jgi:hypothetical protein